MFNFSVVRDLRKKFDLTIAGLSERTGISAAVISKLERNQTLAELGTLFRLARAFGITGSELLALAESRTAQRKHEESRTAGDFHFRQIVYSNASCFYADAPAGSCRSNPDAHRDEYEICWVLKGRLRIELPYESHVLEAGDSLQFDALFAHTYEALTDCRIIIQHVRKAKRF